MNILQITFVKYSYISLNVLQCDQLSVHALFVDENFENPVHFRDVLRIEIQVSRRIACRNGGGNMNVLQCGPIICTCTICG